MKRNKLITLGLATLMGLSLIGCGSNTNQETTTATETTASVTTSSETTAPLPTSITITSLGADATPIELEVPYNPQRVAILDMSVLDMMDNWGLGNQVVGMAKSSSLDYLASYFDNEDIVNLGTLKEVDMEALMAVEPDIIFIGGRLSSQYDALSEIAPVVYLATDYEIGLIESIKKNATTVASIFGVEDMANEKFADFDSRIAALSEFSAGKTAVVGMVTSSNFNTLGNDGRCSIIGREIGFENLANDVNSTHGNESSFELLVSLNPDYIFVLDRDSAIGTEGAKLAEEVMNNELVAKTTAGENGDIVYLTPTVWYLAEGGLTATDIMLQDLESALLN